MTPLRAAARAAALLAALTLWSCSDDEPESTPAPDAGAPDAGRPDAGQAGTVINAPDNQAQRYVSTDPRHTATWTFDLRSQVAIPSGVREVYVEVRACRHDYEPPGAIRFRTPESTSWRELSVNEPLCDRVGIPSAQIWFPVSEPPKLVVEAVRPGTGGDSYVLTTVKVLGWRSP
jgi:hypothetical protein